MTDSSQCPQSPGATFWELVLFFGVVAIGAAQLTAMTAKAHNRTACKPGLKRLGLALHNYKAGVSRVSHRLVGRDENENDVNATR